MSRSAQVTRGGAEPDKRPTSSELSDEERQSDSDRRQEGSLVLLSSEQL